MFLQHLVYIFSHDFCICLPGSVPSCVKFVMITEVLSTANTSPPTLATLSVMAPIKYPWYLPSTNPVKEHLVSFDHLLRKALFKGILPNVKHKINVSKNVFILWKLFFLAIEWWRSASFTCHLDLKSFTSLSNLERIETKHKISSYLIISSISIWPTIYIVRCHEHHPSPDRIQSDLVQWGIIRHHLPSHWPSEVM